MAKVVYRVLLRALIRCMLRLDVVVLVLSFNGMTVALNLSWVVLVRWCLRVGMCWTLFDSLTLLTVISCDDGLALWVVDVMVRVMVRLVVGLVIWMLFIAEVHMLCARSPRCVWCRSIVSATAMCDSLILPAICCGVVSAEGIIRVRSLVMSGCCFLSAIAV